MRAVVTGAGYALLGWFGLKYAYLPNSIPLLWLPTGWAIGMVWWWGRPALIGVTLAIVGLSFWIEGWGWTGFVRAGIGWVAYGGVMWALKRCGFDANFSRLRDLWCFTTASFAILMFTAVLQNGVNLLTGRREPSTFIEGWLLWWGGNYLGGLLMATPLLARSHFRRIKPLQWGGIALIAGVMALLTYLVRWTDPSEYALILLILALPLLMGAVLSYEIVGLSVTLLTLAFSLEPPIGIFGDTANASMSPYTFFAYWLFLAVSYHTMMVLGVYVRQKREFGEKLENAYMELEAILENAPTVAMQGYNGEGRVVFWNRASEVMYGYSREQTIGKTLDQLIFSPEQEQEYQELIRTLMRTGRPAPLKEWEIHTVDGKTRYILSSLFPIRLRESTIIICADIDITERKRLEQQLLQSQKMESIGRLAGGIAHDFNNLLSLIIGFAELAMERVPPDHPVQQDLRYILTASEKAATLVKQLLGFARKQFAQPRPTDLNQVLQEMLPLIERTLGEKIRIKAQIALEPGVILIDPAQMEQIILNLVLNARDAMPSGGTIILRTEHYHANAPFPALPQDAPPGDYECLIVKDEGGGIAPDEIPHIFEPFFTTKGSKGHGLGLATVYGIVAQNHGFITVKSELGRGTEFRIYFLCVNCETHAKN